jgi:hypothetical protein
MLGTFISDSLTWAERVFGGSTLCDERLTDRLVQYAAAQALDPEGSTSRVTGGSKAAREGAYRFLENPRVLPADIDEGPFEHTASLCKGRSRILAVQDTTSVAVASNELREALVSSGSPTGFIVHNTLMVDGESGEVLGLIDQQRWTRETSLSKGGYGPKESAKWGIADLAMASRLGNVSNVITVSDRESDIFELLAYYQETDRRFVVRALHNRQLSGEIGQVFEQVRASEVLGHREIHVEQRGAVPKKVPNPGRRSRPRRKVLTSVQAVRATIAPPGGEGGVGFSPLTLNVVRVSEAKPPDDTSEALEWILLTTEPIATLQDVLRVVQAYELTRDHIYAPPTAPRAARQPTNRSCNLLQPCQRVDQPIRPVFFVSCQLPRRATASRAHLAEGRSLGSGAASVLAHKHCHSSEVRVVSTSRSTCSLRAAV